MDKLTQVVVKPLIESIYIKPMTMCFTQNGTKRTWDLLAVHDSVAIIIYNISRNVLVFVKQFRPAVYLGSIPKEDQFGEIDVIKYPAALGFTMELCAGIVDKNLPNDNIAAEEVLEECGYKIDASKLEKVSTYRGGVGATGSIQVLYYCEVTDEMKKNSGGGVDDEIIDVIEMTIPEVKEFLKKDYIPSPPSFLYAVQWFISNKLDRYINYLN